MRKLKTKRRLTTAYHPEADGLAEKMNKVIKTMLSAFCEGKKTDWDEHLPMLEFAYNSSMNAVTKRSPFFLNYGREPFKPIDIEMADVGASEEVVDFAAAAREALELSRELIRQAQERMKRYEDKHRRSLVFKEGDKVYLSAKNIALPASVGSYKFNEKYPGPFIVKRKISDLNYELELPALMKIHPVFHVSKLKEFRESDKKFGERNQGPFKEFAELEDDSEWEIEAIVGVGIKEDLSGLVFRVKWKGYDKEEDLTWEAPANIIAYGGKKLLEAYKRRNATLISELRVEARQLADEERSGQRRKSN